MKPKTILFIFIASFLVSCMSPVASPPTEMATPISTFRPMPTKTKALTPTRTSTRTPRPTWTPMDTATPIPSLTHANTQTPSLSPTPSVTDMPLSTIKFAQIVQLDTLNSYRLHGRMSLDLEQSETTSALWTFTQEWDKKSQALHIIELLDTSAIAGSSVPTQNSSMSIEAIIIGNTYWFRALGNDWMRLDYQQPQLQQTSSVNLPTKWPSMKPIGETMISNIRCIHYIVDEDIVKMSDQNGTTMATHAQGDIWIANQSDIPPVMIRARIQMQVSGIFSPSLIATPSASPNTQTANEMVYTIEYEVADINVPIIIEPPQMSTK